MMGEEGEEGEEGKIGVMGDKNMSIISVEAIDIPAEMSYLLNDLISRVKMLD